jgi:hypothetical protein
VGIHLFPVSWIPAFREDDRKPFLANSPEPSSSRVLSARIRHRLNPAYAIVAARRVRELQRYVLPGLDLVLPLRPLDGDDRIGFGRKSVVSERPRILAGNKQRC